MLEILHIENKNLILSTSRRNLGHKVTVLPQEFTAFYHFTAWIRAHHCLVVVCSIGY